MTFIFGLLAGIGGVCYILGRMLEKRNSFGDSHAHSLMYTQLITYTEKSNVPDGSERKRAGRAFEEPPIRKTKTGREQV